MVKIDRLLLCDCAGSMKIDAESAQAATGASACKTCSNLCTKDMDIAAEALAKDGTSLIACAQTGCAFGRSRAGSPRNTPQGHQFFGRVSDRRSIRAGVGRGQAIV